ncbi:MAG: hypothetical protein Q7T11_08985 [Deltaproteobacteria bacterium]|nr:hypothetical protein [Deltaproteobacteria bacterium]
MAGINKLTVHNTLAITPLRGNQDDHDLDASVPPVQPESGAATGTFVSLSHQNAAVLQGAVPSWVKIRLEGVQELASSDFDDLLPVADAFVHPGLPAELKRRVIRNIFGHEPSRLNFTDIVSPISFFFNVTETPSSQASPADLREFFWEQLSHHIMDIHLDELFFGSGIEVATYDLAFMIFEIGAPRSKMLAWLEWVKSLYAEEVPEMKQARWADLENYVETLLQLRERGASIPELVALNPLPTAPELNPELDFDSYFALFLPFKQAPDEDFTTVFRRMALFVIEVYRKANELNRPSPWEIVEVTAAKHLIQWLDKGKKGEVPLINPHLPKSLRSEIAADILSPEKSQLYFDAALRDTYLDYLDRPQSISQFLMRDHIPNHLRYWDRVTDKYDSAQMDLALLIFEMKVHPDDIRKWLTEYKASHAATGSRRDSWIHDGLEKYIETLLELRERGLTPAQLVALNPSPPGEGNIAPADSYFRLVLPFRHSWNEDLMTVLRPMAQFVLQAEERKKESFEPPIVQVAREITSKGSAPAMIREPDAFVVSDLTQAKEPVISAAAAIEKTVASHTHPPARVRQMLGGTRFRGHHLRSLSGSARLFAGKGLR